MKAAPLQDDLVTALRTGPKAVWQLTDELNGVEQAVRVALQTLCDRGRVRRHGHGPSRNPTHPAALFELVQCHPLNAQEGV
jgi:hypothetical protein